MRLLAVFAVILSAGCGGADSNVDLAVTDLGQDQQDDLATADLSEVDAAKAPATWVAQTSGVTTNLTGVWSNGSAVFVVGESGTVLRSTDRGAHWTPLVTSALVDLAAVTGNGANVYVGGALGTIRRSSNGGDDWSGATLPNTANVTSLSATATAVFAAQEVNNAAGGLLKSTDQGANFSQLFGIPQPLRGVFASGSRVVVGGAGATLLYSNDEGAMFSPATLDAATDCIVYDVFGTSAGDIYISGLLHPVASTFDVLTFHSTDAVTWTPSTPVNTNALVLAGLWASGSELIVIGASNFGRVSRSTDKGVSWTVDTSTSSNLSAIGGTSLSDLYIVGSGGLILHLE